MEYKKGNKSNYRKYSKTFIKQVEFLQLHQIDKNITKQALLISSFIINSIKVVHMLRYLTLSVKLMVKFHSFNLSQQVHQNNKYFE